MHIILTDSDDIPNCQARLRLQYPRLMLLELEKNIKEDVSFDDISIDERKSPLELFAEFYKKQNGDDLAEDDISFLQTLLENMEGENETN